MELKDEQTQENNATTTLSEADMIAAGVSPEMAAVAAKGHASQTSIMENTQPDLNVANEGTEVEGAVTDEENTEDFGGFNDLEALKKGYSELLGKMSRGEHKAQEIPESPEGLEEAVIGGEQENNGNSEVAPISMTEIMAEMESNNGKITDETKKSITEKFQKIGLPPELLDRFESLENVSVDIDKRAILSQFGSDDERGAIFEWAKREQATNPNIANIVTQYNKATTSRDVDNAKTFATILTDYYKNANKSKVNIVGNNEKRNPKNEGYKTEGDMIGDIRSQIQNGGIDMNALIAKTAKQKGF